MASNVQPIKKAGKSFRLSSIVNSIRNAFISGGYDYSDTMHNIYEDFGYPQSLEFTQFLNMYRRFGVAKAVVDILVDLTWVDAPQIKSDSESFINAFEKLADKTKLWNRMKGLDKRQRVGRYAGLYVQARDGKPPNEELRSLNGVDSIVNLTPMYEGQLTVATIDNNPMSDTFGHPTMYDFNSSNTGNRNEELKASFQIHPSRIIMAAEGADDGSIYGISSLECIYNDLMDLRKITGAGGEGYYQNTRNAPVFSADDDFTDEENEEALAEAIDDWLAKHRKRLVLKGIEAKYPNIQLSDPKEFYQNSLNNIAAGSGIPAAFLVGQQTGRLASDKDSRHLMTIAQSRRDNFLTLLVQSFVDWCIDHNVIPGDEYEICWGDLLTLSSTEKVDVIEKMSAINEKQFRAGGQPVFSEEEMREYAGYSTETADMPDERPTALDMMNPEEPEQEGDDEEVEEDTEAQSDSGSRSDSAEQE